MITHIPVEYLRAATTGGRLGDGTQIGQFWSWQGRFVSYGGCSQATSRPARGGFLSLGEPVVGDGLEYGERLREATGDLPCRSDPSNLARTQGSYVS